MSYSTIPTLRQWLMKHRNESCPQHGFHIANSLVTYSGYCRICNQFWKFRRSIEMKNIPYHWYYFNPETRKPIGKMFRGKLNEIKKSNKSIQTT